MVRKLNIKIMLVIICSAAFSLYGVVGASEVGEPVQVQEVERVAKVQIVPENRFDDYVEKSLKILSVWILWYIFTAQKRWDKEKIKIQEDFEKRRLEEIREWEKKKYYRDMYVNEIYPKLIENIWDFWLLTRNFDREKMYEISYKIKIYNWLLKQIPDKTWKAKEIISDLDEFVEYNIQDIKRNAMTILDNLEKKVKIWLDEILKNIIN